MDAVLNRFDTEPSQSSGWRGVYPAVNLYETADAYMLMAELPGLETEDIDVSLEGSTVTLRGERKIDYANEGGVSLHRRERQVGSFRRAFELPAVIDADKVEAVHRNGVLMLRLPKSAASQPRQISVQAS
jgi:HSP20 family protein